MSFSECIYLTNTCRDKRYQPLNIDMTKLKIQVDIDWSEVLHSFKIALHIEITKRVFIKMLQKKNFSIYVD